MDELNIKCLQILRAMVHNEERRLPDDWPTRTAEPKVAKYKNTLITIKLKQYTFLH
jgi:inositol 1,4,5-triphosphate receptor type 1